MTGCTLVHENAKNNIAREYHLSRGDVEADFASCDCCL